MNSQLMMSGLHVPAPDNAATVARPLERLQRPRQRWLATMLLIDLSALIIDQAMLGQQGLMVALLLRVGLVAPLLLLALVLNRASRNAAVLDFSNAIATFAFATAATAIGLWAPEPTASRYMVAALFIIFSATIFATLPTRMTYWLLALSMLAYAGIVAIAHLPVTLGNLDLDLIGLGVALGLVSITIRQEIDSRREALQRLRRIDAERTMALHEANAKLAQLSATDPLTGLRNRRHLNAEIERRTVSIAPQESGVLMVDVDHFKRFNDCVGHSGGDRCLQLIAGALRDALRSGADIAARYGGEEFVVILPDADLTEALAIAERLRQAVSELAIPHPGLGDGSRVTVSIGVAATTNGAGLTDAIETADRRLYAAKAAGRNRVLA